MVVSNTGNQIPFLFKNYETNQLLYTDNISIRYYYLTDTLENFKWSITKEKEKILNYNLNIALGLSSDTEIVPTAPTTSYSGSTSSKMHELAKPIKRNIAIVFNIFFIFIDGWFT